MGEPEHLVRDLVVVGLVPLGGNQNEPGAETRFDRQLATLLRHGGIGLAHGARDPRDVVAQEDVRKRRHKPAGPPAFDRPAALPDLEADGPAVGGHDERRLHGADGSVPRIRRRCTYWRRNHLAC